MSILISILVPILAGVVLFLLPFESKEKRKYLIAYMLIMMVISEVLSMMVLLAPGAEHYLIDLTVGLPIYFKVDSMGRLFAWTINIVWMLSAIFATEYMKHESCNKRYFGCYLMVYGVLMAICYSGNMITFYAFFEMMTILSVPLVLHTLSREAIMAGLKYMFYSFCGAYFVLFGLFFLCRYTNTLTFTAGGTLDQSVANGHEVLLLVCCFLMIMGFSVKAGMLPMHAWLPTAHPVAPAPASAVLSGVIVKVGVFGIIRVVFYLFGSDFIKGTWVQTVWMILALITVFMGSMLAYREDVLKKRLAYSTVSQLSYILFGLSVLNETAMVGSLLHIIFHAFIKTALFLGAGAIIYKTGKTKVSELSGIGKQMPITIWSFVIVSLGLIGIPPTGGFLSKWYLAIGSLQNGMNVLAILGPVILLISALLTAGYLLPIMVKGFFPGSEYDYEKHVCLEKQKEAAWLYVPMIILAGLTLVGGMFPSQLLDGLTKIAGLLL